MNKVIMVLDIDAFFAQAEEIRHPELINKPIGIGYRIMRKGILATSNYKARKYGIYSGIPQFMALKLCPNIIIIEPDIDYYLDLSEKVFQIVTDMSDQFEPSSIDEGYADVTKKLLKSHLLPIEYAKKIQKRIFDEIGLTTSIGLSDNRIYAKIASGFNKPNGIGTLWRREIEQKLFPLDISRMFYVGKATSQKFKENGINTINDLVSLRENSEEYLYFKELMGKPFDHVYQYAKFGGSDLINSSRVDLKSLGHATTLPINLSTYEEISQVVLEISKVISKRLNYRNLKAKTLTVGFKMGDKIRGSVTATTKSKTFPTAFNSEEDVFINALRIVENWWKEGLEVKYVGISVSNVSDSIYFVKQLGFNEKIGERSSKVSDIIKTINTYYSEKVTTTLEDLSTSKEYNESRLTHSDNVKFKRWD